MDRWINGQIDRQNRRMNRWTGGNINRWTEYLMSKKKSVTPLNKKKCFNKFFNDFGGIQIIGGKNQKRREIQIFGVNSSLNGLIISSSGNWCCKHLFS